MITLCTTAPALILWMMWYLLTFRINSAPCAMKEWSMYATEYPVIGRYVGFYMTLLLEVLFESHLNHFLISSLNMCYVLIYWNIIHVIFLVSFCCCNKMFETMWVFFPLGGLLHMYCGFQCVFTALLCVWTVLYVFLVLFFSFFFSPDSLFHPVLVCLFFFYLIFNYFLFIF